jgi:hypothetical protein
MFALLAKVYDPPPQCHATYENMSCLNGPLPGISVYFAISAFCDVQLAEHGKSRAGDYGKYEPWFPKKTPAYTDNGGYYDEKQCNLDIKNGTCI